MNCQFQNEVIQDFNKNDQPTRATNQPKIFKNLKNLKNLKKTQNLRKSQKYQKSQKS